VHAGLQPISVGNATRFGAAAQIAEREIRSRKGVAQAISVQGATVTPNEDLTPHSVKLETVVSASKSDGFPYHRHADIPLDTEDTCTRKAMTLVRCATAQEPIDRRQNPSPFLLGGREEAPLVIEMSPIIS
jgi:hypothetical protein